MPDESLDVQFARLEEQIRALAQLVEGTKFIAESVHLNERTLAVHDERLVKLRGDLAEFKGELQAAVGDIRKSCNDLSDLIRAQGATVASLERDAEQQTEALGRREKWLLLFATALAGGGVSLLVSYLGRHL